MKDIEPIHSLAISMQARPKLYALLLGSGVSKAANMPTGWEVVLRLAKELAVTKGANPPDVVKWYRDNYHSEPDYSQLLERLAPTPADRQQLQRQYWEASSTNDGPKQPTKAHRAIADLVKGGFVKIIVTTNFDRLVENALREAGVEPMILKSPDDIAGMTPLDHIDCCVVKLHGDYMDDRILNTADELGEYPEAVNKLLDRIIDEYGLVVCGWSGDWDVALSKAIQRAPTRRYTTYWAAYGGLGNQAEHMIAARDARIIEIGSADQFFVDLSTLVCSLRDHAQAHPLSVQATVAQCKRFLAHDHHRIELVDLVDSVGREALDDLANLPELESSDGDALTEGMRRYEEVCSKLLTTAVTASYWSDVAQIEAWRNTLERIFQDVKDTGRGTHVLLSRYPAVLLTYALGIGAVARGHLDCLGRILTFPTGRDIKQWDGPRPVRREGEIADGLSDAALKFAESKKLLQGLEGMEGRHVPLNDWLYQSLRPHTTMLIPSAKRFERVFDRMEVLLALGCGVRENEHRQEWPSFPFGCFVYRQSTFLETVREIEESLYREGNDSPFVRYRLAGHLAEDALVNLGSFRDFVGRVRRSFLI